MVEKQICKSNGQLIEKLPPYEYENTTEVSKNNVTNKPTFELMKKEYESIRRKIYPFCSRSY